MIMRYEEVKELIAIFEKSDLNDMEIQFDNAVIKLNRNAASSSQAQAVTPVAVPENTISEIVNTQVPVIEPVQNTVSDTPAVEYKNDTSDGTGRFIKAPIVGTFYQSSAPDKPPFVKVGDTIAEGDVVCIIEAMKFMNEVNSEESGKITEVLVNDGDFVEFGQPLFRVE